MPPTIGATRGEGATVTPAETLRRWRLANPEKAREQGRRASARWRKAHPERAAASCVAWRSSHRGLLRAADLRYQRRQPEQQRAKRRRRAARALALRGAIWCCIDPRARWTV